MKFDPFFIGTAALIIVFLAILFFLIWDIEKECNENERNAADIVQKPDGVASRSA